MGSIGFIPPVFTSAANGLVPASGGGTTNFLRADGAFASPGSGGYLGGALVKPSADVAGANYSTIAAMPFDSEVYDTANIHDNSTNNSRLTVPSGITHVRVSGSFRCGSIGSNIPQYLVIYKNGALFDGAPYQNNYSGSGGSGFSGASVSSPVLIVTAGDYFQLMLTSVDNSILIEAAYNWFSMTLIA